MQIFGGERGAFSLGIILLQKRIKGTEKASPISQGGLDNSQSHSANVFRVDDSRSEPRVLHGLTQKKMDAESDIAICFVDEND